MTNAGGLRADFPAGEVTYGVLLTICPFGNDITELKAVPSNDILDALEHGLSAVEDGEGRFGHWSGVRFVWDPELPPYNRIVSASILAPDPAGTTSDNHMIPLVRDMTETWDIITSTYIAKGGDGYTMLEQYWDGVGGYFVDYDLLVKYVENHTPVLPHLDGRISTANTTDLSRMGACWDHSVHCAYRKESTACNDDGTIAVDGGVIRCYETCGVCPNQPSSSETTACPDANENSGVDVLSTLIAAVLVCLLF